MTARLAQAGHRRVPVHLDVVRRQDPLQPRVRTAEPERRGPGQDQVDLDVREHPRSPPVVAGHEERLERCRSARRGLGRDGEDDPPGAQAAQRGQTRAAVSSSKLEAAQPSAYASASPGVAAQSSSRPGADDQRGGGDVPAAPGGDRWRRRVDGDDLVADGRAPVGQHPVGGAAERRHARLAAGDVVEERAVAVDRPRLDDRDVARSRHAAASRPARSRRCRRRPRSTSWWTRSSGWSGTRVLRVVGGACSPTVARAAYGPASHCSRVTR